MQLTSILNQYHNAFQAKYGSRLLPGHLRAIDAINRCRTPEAGQLLVRCTDCGHTIWQPRSCGHRNCPQCQNHETSLWMDRQQAKLLPVEYFMVTFTLPCEFRILAWKNQTIVYNLLFACASNSEKMITPRHRSMEKIEIAPTSGLEIEFHASCTGNSVYVTIKNNTPNTSLLKCHSHPT